MAALSAIAKGHKPSIANFPMAKLSLRSNAAVERPRYGPVEVGLTVFSPRSPLPCGTKACRRPQSWLLMAEILHVEHLVGTRWVPCPSHSSGGKTWMKWPGASVRCGPSTTRRHPVTSPAQPGIGLWTPRRGMRPSTSEPRQVNKSPAYLPRPPAPPGLRTGRRPSSPPPSPVRSGTDYAGAAAATSPDPGSLSPHWCGGL